MMNIEVADYLRHLKIKSGYIEYETPEDNFRYRGTDDGMECHAESFLDEAQEIWLKYKEPALHVCIMEAAQTRSDCDFIDNKDGLPDMSKASNLVWVSRIKAMAFKEVKSLVDADNVQRLEEYEEYREQCTTGMAEPPTACEHGVRPPNFCEPCWRTHCVHTVCEHDVDVKEVCPQCLAQKQSQETAPEPATVTAAPMTWAGNFVEGQEVFFKAGGMMPVKCIVAGRAAAAQANMKLTDGALLVPVTSENLEGVHWVGAFQLLRKL